VGVFHFLQGHLGASYRTYHIPRHHPKVLILLFDVISPIQSGIPSISKKKCARAHTHTHTHTRFSSSLIDPLYFIDFVLHSCLTVYSRLFLWLIPHVRTINFVHCVVHVSRKVCFFLKLSGTSSLTERTFDIRESFNNLRLTDYCRYVD
jgi:hypothetical protein